MTPTDTTAAHAGARAPYELTIADQMGQIPEGYAVQADPDNTPAEVIDHVIRDPNSHLPSQTPNGEHLAYDLALGDRKLVRDQPLGAQGVLAGARLTVLNKNIQGHLRWHRGTHSSGSRTHGWPSRLPQEIRGG